MTFRATLTAVVCTIWLTTRAYAAIAEARQQIDLPPGDLARALLQLSKKYGADLIYRPDQVHGLKTGGVHGNMTSAEAALRLLEGTKFEIHSDPSGAIVVTAPGTANPRLADEHEATGDELSPRGFLRLAQSGSEERSRSAPVRSTAAEGAERGTGEELQVVVVTAQKRMERLLDVPAAITAITQQELDALGVNDVASFSRVAPSFSFTTNNTGDTEPRFSMRGLTTGSGLAPVVSVYINDTPMDFRLGDIGGQTLIDLYDLERVEVLRGPQGTILGSSSLGGAVRIVTAKPSTAGVSASSDFMTSVTDGGGLSYEAKGALNLPLSGNAAIRFVLSHVSNAGWIDAVVPVSYTSPDPNLPVRWRNENSSDRSSARVELAWNPTDTLTVRPSLIFQQTRLGDSIQGSYKAMWDYRRPQVQAEGGTVKVGIAGLTLEQQFESFSLTSASNVVLRRKDVRDDNSEYAQAFAPAVGLPSLPYPAPQQNSHYDIGYSEELRATSTGSGPLRWIGGLYYNLSEGHEIQDWRSSAYQPAFGTTSDLLLHYDVPVKDVQYAAFGEGTYAFLNDSIEVAAGARFYRVDSELAVNWGGPFGAPNTPLTKSTAHGVSPRVSVTYKPGPRVSVYATYSQGFRPGGPNPGEAIVGDPYVNCTYFSLYKTSYGPDKSKNYEVGLKTQLVSGFSMNVALYQLEWTNFQATVQSSCGAFNGNLGSARNRGVEWESQARLNRYFRVYAGFSFNDGVITSVVAPVAAAGATTVGQRLINTPRIQGNLGAQAEFPLSNSTQLYLRASYQYSGQTPTSYTNTTSDYQRPAYRNVDTTFGWRNESWDIGLFGRNLTNDRQIQTIAQPQMVGPDLFPGRPRTFGAEVRYSFH